jgi:hypothetical protein
MAYSSADLEMVNRHIAQGERHVVQQEELITRLRAQGIPTDEAEQFLAEFQLLLRQHRDHRSTIVKDIDGPA